MRIVECELVRLQTPFRRAFKHAAAARTSGDAIIVRVLTARGTQGFGEIQARPYVTGENNDAIWDEQAPELAERIVGQEVLDYAEISDCLGGMLSYQSRPALIGGFDIALLDALELEHGACWPDLFGPPRKSATTKCLTIGADYAGDDLRNQARLARVGGYGVVKLKVCGTRDVERIQDLRACLGSKTAIRLDANGTLDFPAALELLQQSADCNIQSIEEPLDKAMPDLVARLERLHEATGVALLADESICTAADLDRFMGKDAYQIVNVRIGKCGGIQGTARLLHAALDAGFAVVSGTMVGETAAMLRASRLMLAYCDELSYVEGLDQAKKLLKKQSLMEVYSSSDHHFEWIPEIAAEYVDGRKIAQ